jgi:CheY-like chemotaxis protein
MDDAESIGSWGGDYDSSPNILIVGDTSHGREAARKVCSGVRARVGRVVDMTDILTAMDAIVAIDAILIDIANDNAVMARPNLSIAFDRAQDENIPVILSTTSRQIDALYSWADSPNVTLLADATVDDVVSAMSLAFVSSDRLVADIATDMDAVRLQRLADEVSRIAKALSNMTATESGLPQPASQLSDALVGFRSEPRATVQAPDASEIRHLIRLRRLRDRYFDAELFADPAWDMLLDLTAARIEHVQVAVSSLCIAAAVPPTTALRWIKAMTDQGLFERCADPDDGRRIFIRLADHTADAMYAYFAAMKRQGGLVI